MIVLPFVHDDLRKIAPQQMQAGELQFGTDAYGNAWTAMADDGPIACAGLVELWRGRAYAWALLSASAGPHMLALTRAIRYRLDEAPFTRIEMACDAGFEAACRWAQMLGFHVEGLARKYLPSGRDAYLYARVK